MHVGPNYGSLWSFCKRSDSDLAVDVLNYAEEQIQMELSRHQVVYTHAMLLSNAQYKWPLYSNRFTDHNTQPNIHHRGSRSNRALANNQPCCVGSRPVVRNMPSAFSAR